ncbi:MAG: hypothetical protein RR022_07265 [Angelakisella sp.]
MAQKENNFSSGEISALMGMVAKKMGTSKQQLENQLKSGEYGNDKVNELLNNKEELQNFLSTPQVQELLRELRKR